MRRDGGTAAGHRADVSAGTAEWAGRARRGGAGCPRLQPDTGAITQELRAVGKRLDGIEAHPALRLTPAAYAQQVTTEVRQAQDESGRSLTHVQGRFSDGLGELRRLIGSAHSQLVQQRREYIAVAIGAGLGFAVWWPLVFLTPWGGGHWLASTLIGGGEWQAGETLMQEADAVLWDRLAGLFKACPQDSATEPCEAAMAVRTVPSGGRSARSCRWTSILAAAEAVIAMQ